MSTGDDYQDEMTGHRPTPAHGGSREDASVEQLLADDSSAADGDLGELLTQLRRLGHGPVPLPTAGLAALLSQGIPSLALARRRSRRRKIAAGVIVGGVASFGLAGVAAANDRLPGGAQGVVSRVVNDFTPFHVSDRPVVPAPDSKPARHPSGVPSVPSPAGPHPASSGSAGHDESSEPGDGDGGSSPTPRPSPTTSAGDGKGGSSGTNREPSDPPISPRPSRTTGDGIGGSGWPSGRTPSPSGHQGER